MKKKFLSLFLVLTMALSSILVVGAKEVPGDMPEHKSLTREEYVTRVAELNGITLDEASELVAKNCSFNIRGGIDYWEFTTTKDFGGGYQVEVGALVQVAIGGGHWNFNDVVDATWSAASGSGSYDWNAFYTKATVESPLKLKLSSRGALIVEVSVSDSTSVGADLELANFSITSSTSKTITYRKVDSIKDYKHAR